MNKIQKRLWRFCRIKPICYAVNKFRFLYFNRFKRLKVNIHKDLKSVLAHDYSLKNVLNSRPSDRILRLILPLTSIGSLTNNSTILSIGCRHETDMIYLCSYGFDQDLVRGADMISYSPWIDTENMHNMSYKDNSWDCVILGWVMAYSDDQKKVAHEVARIVKPGGIVAIGVTWYSAEQAQLIYESGEYAVDPRHNRIATTSEFLDLFDGFVDNVYFRHDPLPTASQGSCLLIFSIK